MNSLIMPNTMKNAEQILIFPPEEVKPPQDRFNLVGQTFGRLTAIKTVGTRMNSGAMWLCSCSCGKMHTADRYALVIGQTKSCGCYAQECRLRVTDIVGKKYGRLTVISRDPCRRGGIRWFCRCECGKEKSIIGARMKNGDTQSCGCLHLEKLRNQVQPTRYKRLPGESAKIKHLTSYKRGALSRDIEWSLSNDEFYKLTSMDCHYCGMEPSAWKPTSNGFILKNGIDRVTHTIGYVYSNCVPCCSKCNRAKYRMSGDEFRSWVRKTYLHLFKYEL